MTGKDFTAFNQVHDQLDGKVRQCGLAGLQNNAGFNLNLNPQRHWRDGGAVYGWLPW